MEKKFDLFFLQKTCMTWYVGLETKKGRPLQGEGIAADTQKRRETVTENHRLKQPWMELITEI